MTPIAPPIFLWFYLSNTAYFLRTDELGWSLDESETWLNEILTLSLLAPQTRAGVPADNV